MTGLTYSWETDSMLLLARVRRIWRLSCAVHVNTCWLGPWPRGSHASSQQPSAWADFQTRLWAIPATSRFSHDKRSHRTRSFSSSRRRRVRDLNQESLLSLTGLHGPNTFSHDELRNWHTTRLETFSVWMCHFKYFLCRIGGTVAAAATSPLEIVKTRLQVGVAQTKQRPSLWNVQALISVVIQCLVVSYSIPAGPNTVSSNQHWSSTLDIALRQTWQYVSMHETYLGDGGTTFFVQGTNSYADGSGTSSSHLLRNVQQSKAETQHNAETGLMAGPSLFGSLCWWVCRKIPLRRIHGMVLYYGLGYDASCQCNVEI